MGYGQPAQLYPLVKKMINRSSVVDALMIFSFSAVGKVVVMGHSILFQLNPFSQRLDSC